MYQLRNLIRRSNVSADPIHKFNESDDFFRLLVKCHIGSSNEGDEDEGYGLCPLSAKKELWMKQLISAGPFCNRSVGTLSTSLFCSSSIAPQNFHNDSSIYIWYLIMQL